MYVWDTRQKFRHFTVIKDFYQENSPAIRLKKQQIQFLQSVKQSKETKIF
jgi:hypothetical protein